MVCSLFDEILVVISTHNLNTRKFLQTNEGLDWGKVWDWSSQFVIAHITRNVGIYLKR